MSYWLGRGFVGRIDHFVLFFCLYLELFRKTETIGHLRGGNDRLSILEIGGFIILVHDVGT